MADTATPGVCGFYLRPEFPYLTLRGKEVDSVLIAVRDIAGSALQLLDLYRLHHGSTRRRNSNSSQRAAAYSRAIIAKVTVPHNVGFLGREHVVMVVHMHNEFANNKWRGKMDTFWSGLLHNIRTFKVQALMGDFNMSLFRVIPELRSRGAQVDLGAWYP